MWQKLIEILKWETDEYTAVLELLKEQQKLIIKNKIAEIDVINQRLQTSYDQTSLWEKKRIALVKQLAESLKLDSQLLTLDKIKNYLPNEYQEDYQATSEQLKKVINAIQRENKNNQDLLKMSLVYVDFSLNLYAGSSRSAYGQKGQEEASGREKSFFNCKV